MATVYLAEDLRHGRGVAIKVLHPELSAVLGPERFLAEIRLTAALQHPHILPLFDSGTAEGLLYYVMPLVEGQTLRARLARERQLPIGDAVRIGREVADALEYAHGRGVVHRDIKPENILLRDGHALVADFGIALAVQQAGGERMTQTGLSLGTPQYMAPEQAMGERDVDRRADIYALGVVVYEMIAGEPPFAGPNSQAIVARVLTEDPRPLSTVRRSLPPAIDDAVMTALEKLPADRFATAAEFAEALGDGGDRRLTAGGRSRRERLQRPRSALATYSPWAVAAAVGLLALGGWLRRSGPDPLPTTRHLVSLGDQVRLSRDRPALALSPDGMLLAFKPDTQNAPIWVKRRADLFATPVPGTERAGSPVFSPDGEWIAFVADNKLKKVPSFGGAVVVLADSATPTGGLAWGDDGTIVYTQQFFNQLRGIDAGGGRPTILLADSALRGKTAQAPTVLPQGRGLLLDLCTCAVMSLYVLDGRTGRERLLVEDVAQAWYLSTGHLLYVQVDGTALAAPFDLDRLEVIGPGVPVADGITVGEGFAQLAWSPAGTMVYEQRREGADQRVAVRVGRDGAAVPVDPDWAGAYSSVAVSPEGGRLAVWSAGSASGQYIWIKDMQDGALTRLTFGGRERRPAWAPDGQRIAFIRDTLRGSMVFIQPTDGTGADRFLARIDRMVQEIAWSPDGEWLVLRTDNAEAGAGDLVGVRLGGDSAPVPLVDTRFSELHPAISPDGRWLAYTANGTGANEVYVRPFPNAAAGLWQVSTAGGTQPRWSRDGRRLYYLDAAARLVEAELAASGSSFRVNTRRPLFDASGFFYDDFYHTYDVGADGEFLFLASRRGGEAATASRLVWVDNWLQEFRAGR